MPNIGQKNIHNENPGSIENPIFGLPNQLLIIFICPQKWPLNFLSISSNADGGAHSKCIMTSLSLDYYRIQKMIFLYFVRKNITKNTLTKTARSDSTSTTTLCILELLYLKPQFISSIYL